MHACVHEPSAEPFTMVCGEVREALAAKDGGVLWRHQHQHRQKLFINSEENSAPPTMVCGKVCKALAAEDGGVLQRHQHQHRQQPAPQRAPGTQQQPQRRHPAVIFWPAEQAATHTCETDFGSITDCSRRC